MASSFWTDIMTAEVQKQICREYTCGSRKRPIGRKYGISPSTVTKILAMHGVEERPFNHDWINDEVRKKMRDAKLGRKGNRGCKSTPKPSPVDYDDEGIKITRSGRPDKRFGRRSNEIRHKISMKTKEWYESLSKEEKLKRLDRWIRAGNSDSAKCARRQRWDSLSEDERATRLKPWIEAGLRSTKSQGTSIEIAIRNVLIGRNVPFIEQAEIGRYRVDFLIPNKNIVIECDGEYWHSSPESKEKDRFRDVKLIAMGYSVIRLTGSDIKRNPKEALLKGLRKVKEEC